MPLITITHTIGCDALAVGRRVADGLSVEIYDDSRLKEVAIRMGVRPDQLTGFQEKAPGWFEHFAGDKPQMYLTLMEAAVYEAARRGRGVIIGHGSQMLLHDFGCALHVLITAHEENRIRNLVQQETALSQEVARKLIRRSDSQKQGFFRFAFHRDWDDPTLYDLCINPDKIGSERAAEIILDMAQSPALKSCSSYALDALERLSQTKRIEASLLEMGLRHAGLKVEMPAKGVARISGVLYRHEDKGRIPAVAGRVPGVEKVELEVTTIPAGHD